MSQYIIDVRHLPAVIHHGGQVQHDPTFSEITQTLGSIPGPRRRTMTWRSWVPGRPAGRQGRRQSLSRGRAMTFHEYLSKAVQDGAQLAAERERLLLVARAGPHGPP